MGNKGQSIVELIFAVGIIVLVVTGLVALSVNNINSKSRGFDRKKATELSQLVMENLIDQKKNKPDEFWQLIGLTNQTWPTTEFKSYVYSIGYTNITNSINLKCGLNDTFDCAQAVVWVGWSGGTNVGSSYAVIFNRFFSRQGN